MSSQSSFNYSDILKTGPVKPFLDYGDLLQLLKDRGLTVEDDNRALNILKHVSYYRFSAYSLTLRKNDRFYEDATFDSIYSLYLFDSEFRSLILKYCSVVEVAFRDYVAHFHSKKYGPLGYLNPCNFSSPKYHDNFLNELAKEVKRSDDVFIEHHKKDLGNVFPIWAVLEVSSFGNLSKMFKNMLADDRNAISKQFIHRNRSYVENWLQCCSYCRNVAAHGGRFYNRVLKSCPVKLNHKIHNGIDNTTPYAFIIAIHSLLPTKAHKDGLVNDLTGLFSKYPFALKHHLGFPEAWKDHLS